VDVAVEWNILRYIPIQLSKLVIPQSAYKNPDPGRIKQEDKHPEVSKKEVITAIADPLEWNIL
jgi:hypothetical protein